MLNLTSSSGSSAVKMYTSIRKVGFTWSSLGRLLQHAVSWFVKFLLQPAVFTLKNEFRSPEMV